MVKKKANVGLQPTGGSPTMDEADGVRVGDEPVPGMRLRCICRGHQGTIGRIAQWVVPAPCGRFIASPTQYKTIRIWDANELCRGGSLRLQARSLIIEADATHGDGSAVIGGEDENGVVPAPNLSTSVDVRRLSIIHRISLEGK
jgi:hypothetical protein